MNMQFIAEYWWMIIVALCIVGVAAYSIYTFFIKPSETQIAKVKEWLLYAVALAEKELGSGTGQLKLRYVYDMFLAKFPSLAKYISFGVFSTFVDLALDKFNDMLEDNKAVETYVKGE